jgi:Na+/melibiose symporter-like transporter
MSVLTADHEKTRLRRLARIATEVAQPPIVLPVLLIWASLYGQGWPGSIGAGVIASVFICIAPFCVVIVLARHGRLSDHHVGEKKQRRPVMLWTLASSVTGCALLLVMGAPKPVWGVIFGILGGIITLIIVSPFWKLSGHATTLGGSTAIAFHLAGWWALAFAVVGMLVCWSRVYLKDHSKLQVVTGYITGFVVFWFAYGISTV